MIIEQMEMAGVRCRAALCHWQVCPEEPLIVQRSWRMSPAGNQGSYHSKREAVWEAPCLGQLRPEGREGYDTVEEAVEAMGTAGGEKGI